MTDITPENFMLTTDFATLKNDDSATITITVPPNIVVPPSGTFTYSTSTSVKVGTKAASLRTRMGSTRVSATRRFVTPFLNTTGHGSVVVTGSGGGTFPTQYSIYAFVSRTSPDTVTAYAVIQNSFGSPNATLVCDGVTETFTFELSTFLSPFA